MGNLGSTSPKKTHIIEHYYNYPPGYSPQASQTQTHYPQTTNNYNYNQNKPTSNFIHTNNSQPYPQNRNNSNGINYNNSNSKKQKQGPNYQQKHFSANRVPVLKHNLQRQVKHQKIVNQPIYNKGYGQKIVSQNIQGKNIKPVQNSQLPSSQMQDQQIQRLKNLIKQYEDGIAKAQQYGKKMQDPNKFQEFKNESLKIYIQKLKQFNFPELDVGEDGVCRKAIVGKISSGKSSMLNGYLNLQLETGQGQTTQKPQVVYNQNGICIIDTPGQNQDFNTEQIENIQLLSQMNEVYILYPDSLKNAQHLIKVITSIKPKHTILLRTKCDMASKKDSKTVEQEIQNDYNLLKAWGIQGIPIYATSAKSIQAFQNKQVKNLLLRHPKNN